MKDLSDLNFQDEVLNSDMPVVVDFWAPWCGPCRMLSPIIEELSGELGDKVKFTKLNVDDNPQVSNQFRIASIPTVMIFDKGRAVENMVGFRPKQALKATIEKYV